ncbi:hypothetical protein HA461_08495 [Rhizobium leguminosarum bv. trifolii]|uniref:hypothetical protein n=1 Tax=Rhizobium leguminosarum TaxID=384 RepID=UPI00140FE16C|nr:hypothetical protein [Rhizobium leguminosarum]QIO51215.1 hypothetical protein HA461_08495 [Rhizobium leguminosarum bv. trifolii]
MSSDDLTYINIRNSTIEMNIVLCLASILNRQDVGQDELKHFDDLSAFMQARSVSLVGASQATAVPVTRGVIVVMLLGYLYNWWSGGAEAAFVLLEPDEFEAMIKSDSAREHDELPLTIKAVRAAGLAHTWDDEEHWVDVGETLLELLKVVLFNREGDTEPSVETALSTHDLLAALKHEGAGLAQMIAYRLLVWSKRLPFLADLAPSKYPPPILPRFSSGTLLDLSLMFIKHGILDQSLDLEITAHEMVEDSETVIRNGAQVEIDGVMEHVKFEVAFGPELLRWSLDDESKESLKFNVNADMKLRSLLNTCCENSTLLEGHRDEDLCDIYTMAYVGTEPEPDDRLGLALKIETVGEIVRCIVGFSEDDVRRSEMNLKVFASREAELMAHIEATIKTGYS